MQGFSLHAAVRCGADERQALDRRTGAMQRGRASRAEVEDAWHDGTAHLAMSPLEFMQRLAARAIEERPWVARAAAAPAPDRFRGVLAPNAELRGCSSVSSRSTSNTARTAAAS